MSVELRSENGIDAFNCSRSFLYEALRLARGYGWKPAGTVEPVIEEDVAGEKLRDTRWSGCYFVGEGQRVTEQDALGMADGLEKALTIIPAREWLSRAQWQDMQRFAGFCRKGSFRIW